VSETLTSTGGMTTDEMAAFGRTIKEAAISDAIKSVPRDAPRRHVGEIAKYLAKVEYLSLLMATERSDCLTTLRRILVIWDAMRDGKTFDPDDWFALMDRARRLVEDGQ
jgi:hypothetical protein